MESISERIVLTNILTEIRFSASPLFSDLKSLTSYINLLKQRFDSVTYEEQLKQIICQSTDGKKQALIFSNRIVVEYRDPTSYNNFVSINDAIVTDYAKTFEVNQFDRTGIRFHMPARFSNFEEAKNLFFDKFFNVLRKVQLPEDLHTGFDSGKVDLYYTLGDNKLYISILPVRMQFMEVKFGRIGHEDTVQNTIEGLLFDMEYFHEGRVTLNQYIDQLKNGLTVVKAKANLLLKALGV